MNLWRTGLYIAVIALTGSAASAGQDALFNHMTGHRALRGLITGLQTTHDVDAAWITLSWP